MQKFYKTILAIAVLFVTASAQQKKPPHMMDGGSDVFQTVPKPKGVSNPVIDQFATLEYVYNMLQTIGWKDLVITIFQIAFILFVSRTILPSLHKRTEVDNRVMDLIQMIYDELLEAREGQILTGRHLEIIANKYGNRLNVELAIRVLKGMSDCITYRCISELYKFRAVSPDEDNNHIARTINGNLTLDLNSLRVVIKQFQFTSNQGVELNLSELITEERKQSILDDVQYALKVNKRVDQVVSEIERRMETFKNDLMNDLTNC